MGSVRFEIHYKSAGGRDGDFIPAMRWRTAEDARRQAEARCRNDITIQSFRIVEVEV